MTNELPFLQNVFPERREKGRSVSLHVRRALGLCADVSVAEVGSGEMSPYWIILIIGLAGGALPSWWVTSTYYQNVISAEHEETQKLVIEQQEENRLDLLAYAKSIVDSGAQHDKDQIIVNRLTADARRVRVVFPTCPVPGTTEANADSSGGTRVATATVDDYMDEAKRAIDDIAERCATLNIDAIRQNERTTK